jgi:rSAM/selenodomain-associated transferase 1
MSTALIIFAKAPVAGLAKTRMIPALGASGAAHLAQQLLLHAVQQAVPTRLDPLTLCVSPDSTHPAFAQAQALSAGRLQLTWQGQGDLGQRMHRALVQGLQQSESVLLMGADAPGLNTAMLNEAAQVLAHHDAVFVPAHDGGYALVGLRRPAPGLFDNMQWSCERVMADTRTRAKQAGLRWHELAPVHDMDEPSDLHHLPLDWPDRCRWLENLASP